MQKRARSMRIGATVATSGLKRISAGRRKRGCIRALRGWFGALGGAYGSLPEPQTASKLTHKPQGSG